MSLNAFRLLFTVVNLLIAILVSVGANISIQVVMTLFAFVVGCICLADIVFLKIYLTLNKDKIDELMKQIGDKDGTSGEP